MGGKIQDISTMQDVLHESMTGLWIIEIEEGCNSRMFADETMLDLLGLTEEASPEECYEHWYRNIDKEYYPVVNSCVDNMIRQGRAEVQYPWPHPVFGRIYIRCGGVAERISEKILRLRGYHQNVTDTIVMRREKEKLEELNEEIVGSLHNLFFAVYRIDMESNSVRAIRVPEDVEEISEEEFSYDLFWDDFARKTLHPSWYEDMKRELSLQHFRELIVEGYDRYTIEGYRKINGEYHYISCNVYFGGKKNWAILALQDTHEQKKREEESRSALKEAYELAQNANKAKSDFLSKMSHDIRTPLNAVIGMTELARLHMDDKERLLYDLEQIGVSSQLLLSLVNEVLDMSKIESGKFELNNSDFNLHELLEEVICLMRTQAEEKKQIFHVSMDELKHERVIGDRARLSQIFLNIMSNACKYTPEGGEIFISVSELSSGNSRLGRYRFVFRDTGIGMSEEYLQHIFEPFSRANDSRISKISGTGLGMGITKNLVQMMGGEIRVESRIGEGSCFTVILELRLQEEKAEEVPELRIQDVDCRGIHILLAEDNELNREIAASLLEVTGACVETAENGKEALEMFRASQPGYYQIIFMDIQMPVMNGYEAVEAIRRLERADASEVVIVAMTANAFAEDVIKSLQAGMNEHLAKPIQPGRMAEVLAKRVLHKM